jgi:hypothetical protein
MEPTLTRANDRRDDPEEELRVQAWRIEQLKRLGLPRTLAERFGDVVDWHALAALVARGCSPELALEIVR